MVLNFCPFCGKYEATIRNPLFPSYKYRVVCLNCDTEGPLAEDANTASIKWNTRKNIDIPKEENTNGTN